jgi:RNA-directed DNA polymerase
LCAYKGDKMDYTDRLKYELENKGYREEYINLCTQYSRRLEENNLPVIFNKEHLALLLGVNPSNLAKLFTITETYYKNARIPKRKPGKYRDIVVPFTGLKEVQRWILNEILYKVTVSEYAKGFKPSSSIVDNAKPHVGKKCVINIDMKDFFPTIKFEKVFSIFSYYGYTNEISYILTKLCVYNNELPQGAPTSPFISNILCKKLDKRFHELCKSLNADYTRYADDITISGESYLVEYIEAFKNIIESEGFLFHDNKLKVRYLNQRQMVTGIIVNKKLSVPRETKKYLRQQIYYCKKFGVFDHMKKEGIERSNYKDYLYGLAYFIQMVEEKAGKSFVEDLNKIYWDY